MNRLPLLLLLAIVGCVCPPTILAPSLAPGDLREARVGLVDYFTALNQGAYARAATRYGGSYETLAAAYPDLPADAHALLLEQVCQNGHACLRVMDVAVAAASDTDTVNDTVNDTVHFTVRFARADGSLFQRAGEHAFDYTVVREGSGFRVQELPPHAP